MKPLQYRLPRKASTSTGSKQVMTLYTAPDWPRASSTMNVIVQWCTHKTSLCWIIASTTSCSPWFSQAPAPGKQSFQLHSEAPQFVGLFSVKTIQLHITLNKVCKETIIQTEAWNRTISPPVSPAAASAYPWHEQQLLPHPAVDLHLAPMHSKTMTSCNVHDINYPAKFIFR